MEIKKIMANFDMKTFVFYLIFSILLIVTLVVLSTVKFAQARYESEATINASPALAFFIVDVQSETGQIKLASMVPRSDPYTYSFEVSNFNSERRANVDLTYSIEIVTTTNMPLNFKVYKGNNMTQNEIDHDEFTTDVNGVYYRHLIIDDASVMTYSANHTDTYVLWVEFPAGNASNPEAYAGVIDLVDIVINAEQVV